MPQSLQTPVGKHQPGKRGGGPHLPMPQRLERLTDRTGECWLWLGRSTRDGYGMMTVDKRARLAHRVSYETHVGPIPDGLQLDHLCRVPACINPAHLEPVTQSENMRRAFAARDAQGLTRVLKPACAQGHPFTEDNTVSYQGRRFCRECRRRVRRESARKRRALKPRQRSHTDHAQVAELLRANPGHWQLAVTCRSAGTASHTASYIRTGRRLPAYSPAGSFEAEFRTVEGKFQVYARFVGEGGPDTEGGAR